MVIKQTTSLQKLHVIETHRFNFQKIQEAAWPAALHESYFRGADFSTFRVLFDGPWQTAMTCAACQKSFAMWVVKFSEPFPWGYVALGSNVGDRRGTNTTATTCGKLLRSPISCIFQFPERLRHLSRSIKALVQLEGVELVKTSETKTKKWCFQKYISCTMCKRKLAKIWYLLYKMVSFWVCMDVLPSRQGPAFTLQRPNT